MVNLNKIFSFKINRQAKNVYPSDVERTVGIKHNEKCVFLVASRTTWKAGDVEQADYILQCPHHEMPI